MGVYRPMLVFLQVTAREHGLPRRERRLDEPHPSIPQHGCIPAEPASVSSDASIVIASVETQWTQGRRELAVAFDLFGMGGNISLC